VKYLHLFKQQILKKDPKLNKTELGLLERQLSYDDIVLFRKITRSQIKRDEIIDKAAKNSGAKKKGGPSWLKKFKIKSKDKDKDSKDAKDPKDLQVALSEVFLILLFLFLSFQKNKQ